MQEETDYKRLFAEARKHLSLEWNYGKLTAVEKLAVLLSGIAFVAVLTVIGALMVFFPDLTENDLDVFQSSMSTLSVFLL